MKIQNLITASQKPDIYTQGTAVMWVDEYISTQLLETHLNQDIDLASRKKTTISSTIEWILNKVPGNNLKILDLGCGPGIYTEKLAEKGHRVTGMDFSANSIRYAMESAKRKNFTISYLQQDYLELKEENQYDLIMLIFTDFGVLLPDQRSRLLANIYRALKPGGVFIFDVLNENYPVKKSGEKEWDASTKGFWKNKPYLALTESFYYEKENVMLSQHVIIDETGDVDIYRFWIHTFSHGTLKEILSLQHFCNAECFDSVLPDSSLYSSEEVTFCVATK